MNRTSKIAATGLALLSLAASSPTLLAAEKAVLTGRAPAGQPVGFDVYVPIQNHDQLEKDIQALQDPSSPAYHKWLTPAQASARYGISATKLSAIQNQLAGFGLQATVVNNFHLRVTGPAGAVEQALGTVLSTGKYKNGKVVVAATQPFNPPGSLNEIGASILGLSDTIRMQAHAHPTAAPLAEPDNRYSTHGGYWFTDLKQAYQFPSYQTYTGAGVTIATLVDGAYSPSDMTKYFTHEALATPQFSEINVDKGAPFNADSFETNLDFQQAGGIAPGASIIHYNIPDLSDQSIVDGLSQIISDNKADIVSMSFGGPEIYYTKADNGGTDFTYILKLEDDLMALGNAQGITFIASSGDSGALSAVPVVCFNTPTPPNCGTFAASVQFPASSPHVTGVGGTNLATTYDGTTRNSAYVSEEAYADPLASDIFYDTTATGGYWGSGGGDSIVFKKPVFQVLANTGNNKYRTVPDLAGHMGGCPGGVQGTCNPADSFVYEVFNNLYYGAIGTSASAPDFAGLTALAIQSFGSGRIGNENSYIYTLALAQSLGVTGKVFNQGLPGFNGLYSTTPTGYNRVLGNGTVNGTQFLLAPSLAPAGVPLTSTNP